MKKQMIIALVLVTALWSSPIRAQTMQSLNREVEGLKEDLQALQRQAYRDKSQNNVPTSTSSGMQQQMTQFEEKVRDLVGRMDELEYKFKQVDERFKLLNQDIDIRFSLLEGKPITNQGLGTNAPIAKRYDAPVAKGAPKSISGESVTGEDLAPLPEAPKPLEASVKEVKKIDVNELYQSGMDAFAAKDYAKAEQSFAALLKDYPQDKLAGNAQYWLGEVSFNKEDYAKSAVAFGRVYKNYKTGNKGAESIYKLGMSMQKLNKKAEACAAYKSLPQEFPKAEKGLLEKAKKAALGAC